MWRIYMYGKQKERSIPRQHPAIRSIGRHRLDR